MKKKLSRRKFMAATAGTAPFIYVMQSSPVEAFPESTHPCCETIGRDIFIESPEPGVAAKGVSYYTEQNGASLMSVHEYISRSDTVDMAFIRRSFDNGETWTDEEIWHTKFGHPDGTGRRHPKLGFVNRVSNEFIFVYIEGVLPTDNPIEGMTQWYLKYRVYTDKGMALNRNRQIIHRGPEYDEDHFMPGITVGENCMMIGGWGGTPVWRDDGVFLLPVQTTIPGENGGFYNPGAGYTWTDSHVLFGETQIDGTIIWSISEPVKGDPETTTRGMVEPTIAKLNNGSILMVMRGSNDAEPELPGYKWASWSRDGGVTWSEPQPWTYSDGSDFYSPSSMSQLLEWGDGRLFWAGNISEDNPRGNHPRFPLVMAEVDRETGLLKHDTLAVIADREDDESEYLQYSNFYCRENRETGLMDVFVTPLFARDFRRDGASPDFTSDAVVIHVKVL